MKNEKITSKSSLSLMYVTARSRDSEGVGLVHTMPATGVGQSLLPISQPMDGQAQAVGVVSGVGAGPDGHWGGMTYVMPVVTVPYANTMGQVNLTWPPSQDVYGKDLPLSDVNTLRYFFNLGTEYFGMSANIQQPPPPQQQRYNCYRTSSPQIPQGFQSGPPASSMLVPYDPKSSPVITQSPVHQTVSSVTVHSPRAKASLHDLKRSQTLSSSSEEKEAKDTMEVASDLSDSGFTSSGEGDGEGEPEAEDDLDASIQPDTTPSVEDEEASGQEVKTVKGKGKRKYYMYGQHKLIKPIKDIPPRFLQLLNTMKAAKERCQGQPVYMLAPPAEYTHPGQDQGGCLNAEAQCFYPRQQYNVCVAGGPGSLTFGNAEAPTRHPPPPTVPPPPSLPNYGTQLPPSTMLISSGGQGSGVVQTAPLPPPTSLPPPPLLPPVDVRSLSLGTSDKTIPLACCQSSVKSSLSAETDNRCTKCAPCQTENASGLSLVPVGVNPRPAVPNMSSSVPSVPPPNFLPVSVCSSSICAEEQSRMGYYVYPSPSLPPLQGAANPGPGLPPLGQVTYVMNPVAYGPPPSCVTYPPPVMYSRPVPCPPVAVQ
ncbi:hypothetical protein ACOMHN_050378 [Nucella lapillus]